MPPARLGHLLLLHLEGGQVHGQGLCSRAPGPSLPWTTLLPPGGSATQGFPKLYLVGDGRE